jgi:hypothetical protein
MIRTVAFEPQRLMQHRLANDSLYLILRLLIWISQTKFKGFFQTEIARSR